MVPLADGYNLFVIVPAVRCCGRPQFSTTPGTAVDAYQLNGGLNQEWQLVPQPNGNYEIFNAYSHLLLTSPCPIIAGALREWQFNDGLNQEVVFDMWLPLSWRRHSRPAQAGNAVVGAAEHPGESGRQWTCRAIRSPPI